MMVFFYHWEWSGQQNLRKLKKIDKFYEIICEMLPSSAETENIHDISIRKKTQMIEKAKF